MPGKSRTGWGMILSFGGGVAPGTPPENMDALLDCSANLERYNYARPMIVILALIRTRKMSQSDLYDAAAHLPLICPHGHVDPRLFADPNYSFGTPVDLLLIPDHYIFRMLYSQGILWKRWAFRARTAARSKQDHRKIWQIFADHFYLFRGTPTGMWLADEFEERVWHQAKTHRQNGAGRSTIKLRTASPRRICSRAGCSSGLISKCCAPPTQQPIHWTFTKTIRASGWTGNIRPTFRPDAVVNLDTEGWRDNIDHLSAVSGIEVNDYPDFIQALEQRRAFFKSMGATATDHAALTPYTERLSKD